METYNLVAPCEVCGSQIGHNEGHLILCEKSHIQDVVVENDPLGFNEYQELGI